MNGGQELCMPGNTASHPERWHCCFSIAQPPLRYLPYRQLLRGSRQMQTWTFGSRIECSMGQTISLPSRPSKHRSLLREGFSSPAPRMVERAMASVMESAAEIGNVYLGAREGSGARY